MHGEGNAGVGGPEGTAGTIAAGMETLATIIRRFILPATIVATVHVALLWTLPKAPCVRIVPVPPNRVIRFHAQVRWTFAPG